MVLLSFFSDFLISATRDKGFQQYFQPNGISFIGRAWGDEFLNWLETGDGYTVVIGSDNYFYYATLDRRGEFIASTKKVGIDKPDDIKQHLRRSTQRVSELLQMREDYLNTLNESTTFSSRQVSYGTTDLAVVLVDFSPSYKNTSANQGVGHYKSNFDNLIFSYNIWYTVKDYKGDIIGPHPQLEEVFGSVNDYLLDQAPVTVTGKDGNPSIINNVDSVNSLLPKWVDLANPISYYDTLYGPILFKELYAEAKQEYPDLINYYNILFITAGESDHGALWPHNQNVLINDGEEFRHHDFLIVPEVDWNSFVHMGQIAHEFCHGDTLDLPDYITDGYKYTLMASGMYNGPLNHGACPAPIDPISKVKKGWVEPIIIEPGSLNYTITTSTDTSQYIYKIDIPTDSDEYFLLEIPSTNKFNSYTPIATYHDDPGILIWHARLNTPFDQHLVEVEFADNSDSQSGNRFPYPYGPGQNQDFTPYTSPSSSTRNTSFSDVFIKNITYDSNTNTATLDLIDPTTYPAQPQGDPS